MKIFGREPAIWVGIIVSCILAVLSVLTGQGVISDALAGEITDGVNAVAQLAVILAPFIATLIARKGTTSYAEPKLPVGKPVLAEGEGDTPPPDAVVARREDIIPGSPSDTGNTAAARRNPGHRPV